MDGTLIHIAFDAIAWLAAGLSLFWLTRYAHVRFPPAPTGGIAYVAALVFGAGTGAVLFGSANLWLSHLPGIARSIEGAIFGGIVAIELYKRTYRPSARHPEPRSGLCVWALAAKTTEEAQYHFTSRALSRFNRDRGILAPLESPDAAGVAA